MLQLCLNLALCLAGSDLALLTWVPGWPWICLSTMDLPGNHWTWLLWLDLTSFTVFCGAVGLPCFPNEVTILSLSCCYLLLHSLSSCAEQPTLVTTHKKQSENVKNALQGHTNSLDSVVTCLQHVWQEKLLKEGMWAVTIPEVQQHSTLIQNNNRITYPEVDFPVPEIGI